MHQPERRKMRDATTEVPAQALRTSPAAPCCRGSHDESWHVGTLPRSLRVPVCMCVHVSHCLSVCLCLSLCGVSGCVRLRCTGVQLTGCPSLSC